MVELERVESLPQKVLSRDLFMNMESTGRTLIGKESGETIFCTLLSGMRLIQANGFSN